jgi:hypothetical protein
MGFLTRTTQVKSGGRTDDGTDVRGRAGDRRWCLNNHGEARRGAATTARTKNDVRRRMG